MLAPDPSLARASRAVGVPEAVQRVLDVIPVTDTVYHHLAFTRPLVDALVREVCRVGPARRVLVIGPNELLPLVLMELGYEVDLWVLDGLPLSEVLQRHASRCGPLNEMLRTPAEHPADVVVAPYIAEAAELEPANLMRVLRTFVKPDGCVVMACRQPGELRLRLRRIARMMKVPVRPDAVLPPSPTWPALPAVRLLGSDDIIRAGEGEFDLVRASFAVDHRAYLSSEALGLGVWLRKLLLQFAKRAVPRFRDCTIVTLVPVGDART